MGPAHLARILTTLLLLDQREELPGKSTASVDTGQVAYVCFHCGVVVWLAATRYVRKPTCANYHVTAMRTVRQCPDCDELLIFGNERHSINTLVCKHDTGRRLHSPAPAFRAHVGSTQPADFHPV